MQLRLPILGLFCLALVPLASASDTPIDREIFRKSGWLRTDSALVMKDGKVLYERYENGYGPNVRHLSWSMAKTVTGILVGVAIDRGYLRYDDPVRKFFPKFPGTATVLDVLQMSSGVDYLEEYAPLPVNADIVRMLYLDGPKTGFGNYVAARPLRERDADPGKHFYYSSGDTALLSEILRLSMPRAKYDRLPWEALFEPLGIRSAVFERDIQGAYAGASSLYLTTREFARLGELLAAKGVWKGRRLIPKRYWDLLNTVAPGVRIRPLAGTSYTEAYTVHARTNQPIPERGCGSEFKDLPLDAILLFGHQGQVVAASPREKLVLVRLGTDKGFSNVRDRFFTASREFLAERGVRMDESMPTDTRSCIGAWGIVLRTLESLRAVPWNAWGKIPPLVRQIGAKEMCSCLYSKALPMESCLADLKQTWPFPPKFSIDRENGIVSAGKDPETASVARWLGPKWGCRLETAVSVLPIEP